VSMLEVWRHAELDPWDLLVEAPGIGELAWAHRRDLFGLLVSERRNHGPHWRNGAWTKVIRMRRSSRVPLPCLRRIDEAVPDDALVRERGGNAALPARIEISDGLLWLLGLWVAEGSWHRRRNDAFITISADQGLLARASAVIERELGLHVVHAPAGAARSASIFVHSKLLLRLLEFLGFEGGRKRIPGWILGLPLSRLKWFIEGYREGDGVHSGANVGVRHCFSTVHDELKDDLVVALARFGLVPSVGRYETTCRPSAGEKRFPFWLLTVANATPWSPLAWDAGVTQRLNARRTGDLVWAAVSEVAEVPPTELVYDFSVPGHENFWAGAGVMASNTYGARMRPHDGRAIPTFLRQALTNRPITVFGDGRQTRSFCYVDDLIRGMIALAESGVHDPVNIGNPDEFTLLELAETVVEVTGASSEIVFEALPTDDPKQRRPDIGKAMEVLGWEPSTGLREGLQRTIEQAGVELIIGAGR
jgi:UDP-glucuronate decarboxylase